MAGGSVNIILLAVLSVAAANTCTLNPITWSCSALPQLTLRFSEVTVKSCDKTYNKGLFTKLVGVTYSAIDQGKTYTAVMVDPDAPGHSNGQAWLHWIRAGLTGKDLVDGTLLTGEDIMAYAPPTPPSSTGYHRYFVFLFEESNPVVVDMDPSKRGKFSLTKFATDNQLCGPLASNMFQTQY